MLDLSEIEAEFNDLSGVDWFEMAQSAHDKCSTRHRDYYVFVRTAPAVRARENAQNSARRQAARLARAESRPPCPKCGRPVTREARNGGKRGCKLPVYCSLRCARAAKWARYAERKRCA